MRMEFFNGGFCFGGGCWVLGSGCGFVVQWWLVRWWLVFLVAIFFGNFGGDSCEELVFVVDGGRWLCGFTREREKKEERKEN